MAEVIGVANTLARDLWRELVYIVPYLLVGVVLEAIIRTFKWHLKIRRALTRFGALSIVIAALLGAVSPLCACATLPLVISLLLAGLPLAPAMALLITSPLMSPASYVMVSAMLGSGWANVVLFCAIFLGIFGGYVTHRLRNLGFSEDATFRQTLPKGNFHDPDYPVEKLRCACSEQLSHRVERRTHSRALVFLAKILEGGRKIGTYALIGLVIEVVVSTFVPNEWITGLLTGEGMASTILITFATIPLHLPQVTAASMVFGFFLPDPGQVIPLAKGPGIAILVGGPVTALPVMAVFLSMFRSRILALYLGLCVVGTLLLALSYHYLPI